MSTKGYQIYIDDMLMPVTPPSITTKINGKNEVVDLLNGGEFNMIKKPGLTDIMLTLRLPSHDAHYVQEWKPQQEYLDLFEDLKIEEDRRVFSWMILRSDCEEDLSDGYMEYMTLEEYEIREDVNEGSDLLVEIHLKQFVPLREKQLKITEDEEGGFKAEEVPSKQAVPKRPQAVEALENDSLFLIAQQYLGDGERFQVLADLNGISNPNDLETGQVIRLV